MTHTHPTHQTPQTHPAIDRDRITRRLIELCGIAGPSGDEGRVAEYLLQFAREREPLGLVWESLSVSSDPARIQNANILLRIPSAGTLSAPILLSAHMDTVPLPAGEGPTITLSPEGVLSAAGASILGGDDRAGIAAAMEMIDLCLQHPHTHAGLEVLFTVEEELGCLGSRTITPGLVTASFGYNLDGETPPGTLIVSAPQKLRYTCTVHGRSAHAALAPEEGINAIKIAADIVSRLPQGQVDGETTANVGSIRGGGQTNIVPDRVEIVGEIRSLSPERCGELQGEIDALCRAVVSSAGADSSVSETPRAEVIWESVYPGYQVDSASPCVTRFRDACGRAGVACGLLSSAGGGDANNLNALGVETVVFGLGMHDIHTPKEYLVLDEFLLAVEILKATIFGG